jgi:hypothetical protein
MNLEFEDFLLSRYLIYAKSAPFYAHRVSKLLTFSDLGTRSHGDIGED